MSIERQANPHTDPVLPAVTRRRFLGHVTALGAAAPLGLSQAAAASESAAVPPSPPPQDAAEPPLPTGTIGPLRVSRLLLGGNLLTHYTHSRDLRYVYRLTERYNTEAKILETLASAEAHGVNTLVIHTHEPALRVLRRYRRQPRGRIQWIVCPTAPIEPGLQAYRTQIDELVGEGVEAIYLWGVRSDQLVAAGQADLLAEAVAAAKAFDVPSGVGAHDLRVVELCEERKVPADFYIKTFHHHQYPSAPRPEQLGPPVAENPGYWCRDPEAVTRVMAQVSKPWIAFKVMAAGAIPPEDAFRYAFAHGADHVLAGMFDFEIAEDVRIARKVLADVKRDRPWRS